MRTERDEKEIVKRALAMLHGGETLDRPSQTECPDMRTADLRPQPATPETLAASVCTQGLCLAFLG